jgi:hypothetical protein
VWSEVCKVDSFVSEYSLAGDCCEECSGPPGFINSGGFLHILSHECLKADPSGRAI